MNLVADPAAKIMAMRFSVIQAALQAGISYFHPMMALQKIVDETVAAVRHKFKA